MCATWAGVVIGYFRIAVRCVNAGFSLLSMLSMMSSFEVG